MEKLKDPLFVSLIWCASTMHPLCDEVADKTFFSLGAVCKFSKKRAWWNRCPTLKIKIGKWCRWKIYHIICKKQNLSSFLENLPKGMKASSSLGLYYSISLRLNYPRRLSPALQLLPEVGSWHALNYHSSIDYMAIMGLPISTWAFGQMLKYLLHEPIRSIFRKLFRWPSHCSNPPNNMVFWLTN